MTASGLAEELEVLQAQRRALRTSLELDGPGDRADQAVALERADDLARIDDRIAEIIRQLAQPPDATLPRGTRIRLRYADGGAETLYVGDAADAERAAGRSVLTPDSPLGMALVGRRPGDNITFQTPAGTQTADVLAVEQPSHPRGQTNASST